MAADSTDDVVTREMLEQFLSLKKAAFDCPSCKSNQWFTDTGDENHIPGLSYFSYDYSPKNITIPCTYLICKNCGLVRTYANFIIRSGLEAAEKIAKNSEANNE